MRFNKKAFTLIELLVVVLIIGILAAIALPKYQTAVYKTRAVKYLTLLDAITKAQRLYFLQHGKYTKDIDDLDISLPDFKVCYNAGIALHYTNGKYGIVLAVGPNENHWYVGDSSGWVSQCKDIKEQGFTVDYIPPNNSAMYANCSNCILCWPSPHRPSDDSSVKYGEKACAALGEYDPTIVRSGYRYYVIKR